VEGLLQKDPEYRYTADEALKDPWLASEASEHNYIDDKIGIQMFSNMSKFIIGESLRRSVYSYIIAKKYYTESNSELLKLFRECDINNDGKIDSNELLLSYGKYFPSAGDEQMDQINEFINKVDINKSGSIEYAEFLTVNNLIYKTINKNMLKEVFDFFDVTKNGSIQIDDLQEIFEDFHVNDFQLIKMLNEFDINKDQEISFAEFYEILTNYLEDDNTSTRRIKTSRNVSDENVIKTQESNIVKEI